MTVKDFIKRMKPEDMDKMLLWNDGHDIGWSNVAIVINAHDVTIRPDMSHPFADGGIVDPNIQHCTNVVFEKPPKDDWDRVQNIISKISADIINQGLVMEGKSHGRHK